MYIWMGIGSFKSLLKEWAGTRIMRGSVFAYLFIRCPSYLCGVFSSISAAGTEELLAAAPLKEVAAGPASRDDSQAVQDRPAAETADSSANLPKDNLFPAFLKTELYKSKLLPADVSRSFKDFLVITMGFPCNPFTGIPANGWAWPFAASAFRILLEPKYYENTRLTPAFIKDASNAIIERLDAFKVADIKFTEEDANAAGQPLPSWNSLREALKMFPETIERCNKSILTENSIPVQIYLEAVYQFYMSAALVPLLKQLEENSKSVLSTFHVQNKEECLKAVFKILSANSSSFPAFLLASIYNETGVNVIFINGNTRKVIRGKDQSANSSDVVIILENGRYYTLSRIIFLSDAQARTVDKIDTSEQIPA